MPYPILVADEPAHAQALGATLGPIYSLQEISGSSSDSTSSSDAGAPAQMPGRMLRYQTTLPAVRRSMRTLLGHRACARRALLQRPWLHLCQATPASPLRMCCTSQHSARLVAHMYSSLGMETDEKRAMLAPCQAVRAPVRIRTGMHAPPRTLHLCCMSVLLLCISTLFWPGPSVMIDSGPALCYDILAWPRVQAPRWPRPAAATAPR